MDTRPGMGIVVATATVFAFYLVSPRTLAAPPQTVDPAAPAVTTAQHALDQVEARYRAGVATNEELERARAALAIAQAESHLQQARDLQEQQQRKFTAGVLSSEELAASRLAVTASEVALLKAQAQQQRHLAERQQVLARAGIGVAKEADVAAVAFKAKEAELAKAQIRYRTEAITLSKSRLLVQQARFRAGVGSQADVDRAQAEYDAVLRQP